MSALCVECDAELDLIGRARVGQRVTCPNCGVKLEVVGLHPVEVDLYIADEYEDDDDWEDELDGFSLEDDMNMDDLDAIALLDAKLSAEDDYDELDLDESEFDEEDEPDELADDFEDDAFALR